MGAATWGANAVTGVINIITRRPEDSVGTFFELGTEWEDAGLARFRLGRWPNDISHSVFRGRQATAGTCK